MFGKVLDLHFGASLNRRIPGNRFIMHNIVKIHRSCFSCNPDYESNILRREKLGVFFTTRNKIQVKISKPLKGGGGESLHFFEITKEY